MVVKKINVMLFRMIMHSKGQFIAVLFIIVTGICAYTSLSMASDNLEHSLDSYYEDSNFPDLFIEVTGVPVQIADGLNQIPGVAKVSAGLTMDVPMLTDNENERKTLRLITITDDEQELSRCTLLKGSALSGKRKEAWIIGQFADANGIVQGDEIRILVAGYDHTLDVVGIVANPEYIYLMENSQSIMPNDEGFGICYLSEAEGRLIMGERQNCNYIRIGYGQGAEEETIINAVKDQLRLYGIISILKRSEQLSNAVMQEELQQLKRMSNAIPVIFLLVAGLVLMMVLSRMIKRDRFKIGALKALGYSDRQIMGHYAAYAVVAGIVGGLLGSITGMLLANAMTGLFLDYFNLPLLKFEPDITYMAAAILLTTGFCVASGAAGAKGVLKITPSDAMREESPQKGGRILIERIGFLWNSCSFSRKLAYKNAFRNKRRTYFVILGIALTYGMMLFAVTMPAASDIMMNQHFTEFRKMDYSIEFYKPANKKAVTDLSHIVFVDCAEGKIEYPFELTKGHLKQSVSVIGIKKDTGFYTFRDISDKRVFLEPGGILLSKNLADALKVEKGEHILVDNYFLKHSKVEMPVAGIIKQSLGMNAYMEIEELRDILFEDDLITGVFVDSDDDMFFEKLIKATNVASVMSSEDVKNIYKEYMGFIFLSIGFMLIFSGVIGFGIVYVSTMISIGEREGEFSSLRVLGFTKKEIFRIIRMENDVTTAVGILAGVPLGSALCRYSSAVFTTNLYSIDMTPTIRAIVLAGFFTGLFILSAQFATYKRIQKMDFMQVLKNRAG